MNVPAPRIDVQPWMALPGTRAVLRALRAAKGEVRFVGGCVRNAALGLPVADIDLATTLLPDRIMAALQAAHLTAVPTGLAHGTVTAVADGTAFEITTLRRDVETDGRRAVVAFTDDWAADAQRRDFTMNALYCDDAGRLLDPVGGLADLQARRVRFVGDPTARIREDYLRVLRFYRFSAWYGREPYDAQGHAACAAAAADLMRLSAERVSREILKLLAAPDPVPAWRAMLEARVLESWLPEGRDIGSLERMVAIENLLAGRDALRRMASLLPVEADATQIAERLRLSTAERERLAAMVLSLRAVGETVSAVAARRLVHRLGNAGARDHLLLTAVREARDVSSDAVWRAALRIATAWQPPAFRLRGADVLSLGIDAGTAVGQLLRTVEEWWIEGDFTADRAACLARLADAARLRGLT